jgi:hypothetical protein
LSDSPITLFIPLGNDRSNAGLTLRAETIDEVNAILADLSETDETEASKLNSLLDGVLTVKAGVELKFPSTVVQTRSNVTHPQATNAPADAPTCTHGSMKWREGVSRSSGNAYKGWFCPAPQGAPGGQCTPKFVK